MRKSWKQGYPLSNTIKDTSTIMRNPLPGFLEKSGLRTYQSSCRPFTNKKKKMTKSAVLPNSIADSDVLVTLGYFMDKRPLQKHSELSKKP